ncbi:MAG: hypothetical protein HYV96_21040 [Opitutae bacterium]|nr:hypothetical protein [Opitutae bacterium]
MDWPKKNPRFAAILLASAAACALQGWLIHTTHERARRAAVQVEAKRAERDWLARQSPALSEENARAIAAEVAAAAQRAAEFRAAIAGQAWLSAPPERPVDGYFALASFTETMRALAVRARVALRTEERFGFATYANEGPEADLLGPVHRQRVVMQHLLEALFEAHPKSLVAAVRERPLTAAQRAGRRAAISAAAADATSNGNLSGAAGQPADFFEPDSRLRLDARGVADGELFRVEFTGQTQALRAFLNSLAASPLPLFVRAVEVEPEMPGASAPVATASAGTLAPIAPVPLVTQNSSTFAVVIECIEVAPAAAAVASSP